MQQLIVLAIISLKPDRMLLKSDRRAIQSADKLDNDPIQFPLVFTEESSGTAKPVPGPPPGYEQMVSFEP